VIEVSISVFKIYSWIATSQIETVHRKKKEGHMSGVRSEIGKEEHRLDAGDRLTTEKQTL